MTDNSEPPLLLRGTLAPLRIPDFRRLLTSNTLWWQAMGMEMVVLGWLVLEITDSAWQVALVGFYRMVPLLAFGFLAGPTIDRFGRRRVIIANQIVNLVTYGAITLLLWTGHLAFWHLAVGAAMLGTAWALDWPARRSVLPDLVGKARTLDAMLLDNFTQNFSRILGPFASGAIIEAFGAAGCFAALTGVSALSLVALLRLSRQLGPRSPASPEASPWALIADGFRYVRRTEPILGVFLITVAANFLVFPYMTLLPVFARDVLNQGPVGLGLLGTACGIGAFFGLLIINWARHRISNGWIFAVGSFFHAASVVGFASSTSFPLSLALLAISGVGQACFGLMQSSIVLISASDDMRSRAMGAIVMGIGAGPPGRLQVGGLAEAFGAPFAVGVSATVAALAIVAVTATLPGLLRRTKADDAPPDD